MFRLFCWILLIAGWSVLPLQSQPRIKGKKLDTTQGILGTDTHLTKLVEFKDSINQIAPKSDLLKEPREADQTGLILLIVGAVGVILWAGRRAWKRRAQ